MSSAYEMGQAAVGLKGELNTLFQQFDQHYQQARSAVLALDQVADSHDADTGRRIQLEQTIQTETRVLERLVAQMQTKKSAYESKKAAARALALEAVSINGFGDHFLTDAFASGHIVTPRDALLTDFATSLLGVVETGGVLNCANIPSLAWHDLDNRFGVWVNNRAGSRWLTFGDDFANSDGLPLGRSQAPTLTHAIDATAGSIRQVWQAAAGQTPTTLAPVLDQLPRPELEPGKYPNWQPDPRQAWERQLMYAAGIGPSSAAPNTRGNQIGLGGGIPVVSPLLSAGMGCVNAIQFFAYDRFVTPMIGRVRAQYWQRYYDARQGQVESSDATPTTQDSVGGHVILGSVIGGLALGAGGAALGYLAGGPIGAVIGGVVGLAAGFLAGGLIGGLTGKKRAERPAV